MNGPSEHESCLSQPQFVSYLAGQGDGLLEECLCSVKFVPFARDVPQASQGTDGEGLPLACRFEHGGIESGRLVQLALHDEQVAEPDRVGQDTGHIAGLLAKRSSFGQDPSRRRHLSYQPVAFRQRTCSDAAFERYIFRQQLERLVAVLNRLCSITSLHRGKRS